MIAVHACAHTGKYEEAEDDVGKYFHNQMFIDFLFLPNMCGVSLFVRQRYTFIVSYPTVSIFYSRSLSLFI